jgi:hypothetical protein
VIISDNCVDRILLCLLNWFNSFYKKSTNILNVLVGISDYIFLTELFVFKLLYTCYFAYITNRSWPHWVTYVRTLAYWTICMNPMSSVKFLTKKYLCIPYLSAIKGVRGGWVVLLGCLLVPEIMHDGASTVGHPPILSFKQYWAWSYCIDA